MFDKIKNTLTNKVNEVTTKVTNKVNTIKEENARYKELLEKTTTFQNLFPITNLTQETPQHKIAIITTDCPDINKDKATIISKLIPISETYLTVLYATEIKTNKEYYLIPTNKYLWIITQNTYGILQYQNFQCEIIKKNLMSKTILINNILLEITGNDTKINTLISILTNPNIRETIIQEKTNYLCGIIPTYQKINSINSGISLDNNYNIVFHNKNQNYRCTPNDIDYYEILLDNSVILSNKNTANNKLTTFQNSCSQITIKITTKDNQTFIMPILEPNTFNTKYSRQDTTFQTNLNFAYELVNILKQLIK